MKKFLGLLVLLCVSYGSGLSATPIFVNNHGYVLGELNTVDLVGLTRKVVVGQVSIGNNSFGRDYDVLGRVTGDYVLNNPWSFCGEQNVYEQLVDHIGEFAVIEYKTPKKSTLLQCQSPNEIVGIYPVSGDKPADLVRESTKIIMAGKPYGVSAGRIVNAQQSDIFGKNWSVVIQVGNSGNDFRYLQIVDADLYALALDSLVSATKVKLYHVEQIHSTSRPGRSDAYVWKIEAMSGL